MATTPRYLFRCSSAQSNGTNTPTLFAPASLSDHDISIPNVPAIADHNADFIALHTPSPSNKTSTSFGEQLRQALLWKKDQAKCPFLFFTTSPIFVIQLAAWRNARKHFKDGTVIEPDTGITITVIDTETARTFGGQAVQFQPVTELLRTHEIELRNRSDGSLRGYADIWVATTDVVPGKGSFYARFEDLINNGFYELYPQIGAANNRKDPRPSLTTDDLRKYFFLRKDGGVENLLMRESLDTAARVAMCFRSNEAVGTDEARSMGVRMAFVLSLRKRNLKDLAFHAWVREHLSDLGSTETSDAAATSAVVSGIPDQAEFDSLQRYFAGMAFSLEGLSLGLSIDMASIQREKADWARWWKSNREEYRASHPREQRQGRRDRRTDRPRELLERRTRVRRDSAVDSTVQRQEPRELFPRWQDRAVVQRERSGTYDGSQGGRRRGYQVLESRPGDATTTRASRQQDGQSSYQVLESRPGDARTTRQQHRHAKVVERRDQDGVYARRGYSSFGGSSY